MPRLLPLSLLLLLAAPLVLGSGGADPEEEAIRAAIEHYFQGHATGQGEHFSRVFHPESQLFWMRDGEFHQRTSADYIAGASGQPAEDEAERSRRIVSIDRTGDAAAVKLELGYPSALITDYMSMLKVDGRWQIVNKVFHVEPRG